jgi:hypothetical protein
VREGTGDKKGYGSFLRSPEMVERRLSSHQHDERHFGRPRSLTKVPMYSIVQTQASLKNAAQRSSVMYQLGPSMYITLLAFICWRLYPFRLYRTLTDFPPMQKRPWSACSLRARAPSGATIGFFISYVLCWKLLWMAKKLPVSSEKWHDSQWRSSLERPKQE